MKRVIVIALLAFMGLSARLCAEKWAVLIGIADYQNEAVRDLTFSEKDARYLKDVLVQYARFKEQNIRLLLGREATAANIKDAVWWLGDVAGRDDLVFFFFSGHGTRVKDYEHNEPDGMDEAFCPWETDPRRKSTVILDDDIGKWFRMIRTNQTVVILDCCHSGGAAGKSLENDRSKGLDIFNESGSKSLLVPHDDPYSKDLDPQYRFIMTASDADEKSYEEPALGYGIFTYYVGEAFKGRGDMNHDHHITVDELYDYARSKTLSKSVEMGKKQTPMKFGDLTNVVLSEVGFQVCPVLGYSKDLGLVTIRIDGDQVKTGDRFRVKMRMDAGAKDLTIADETVWEVEISQTYDEYAKAKVKKAFYDVNPTGFDNYYAERIATGVLKIRTEPWSTVFLNGREMGSTPLIIRDVPTGEHDVTFKFDQRGYGERRETVELTENEEKVLDKKYSKNR